jgi:thiamine transport system permease protein
VCGIGLTAGLLLPLWALAASSFMTRSGFGFQYWISLFRDVRHSIFYTSPLQAAAHSLMFSAATVVISLSLGVPAAYVISRTRGTSGRIRAVGSGIVDLLFLLPLGTSAVTLGFGFIISLNSPPLELRSSILLIPIAHSLVALPLVVRSLLAPLSSINPRLRETAALLGSGPLRVRLEVDLPILRRAFIAAAAFAFTVSMGEFAATALLTRPDLATIPVVIYGSLTQPGELNQGQALAMSTILMAVCGLGLAAIERFRAGGTEVF